MQALREAEEANLELSGAQRLSWAAFGRSRALESTATSTMLSARRSRFFASASRRARPLLRREERRRTTVAFSAQPSNSSRTEPRFGEHCYQHNAQCAKKPLLRLRQPECPAAAETRRTKAHNSGILCAALKPSKDAQFLFVEMMEKLSTKLQSLTEAEEANLELSGAQRLSWAAFGRSRALESTATGTMLSARRSRFFASASRRARPLLRREERRRTTVAFSAQPSNPARTEPRFGEHCYRHNAQCAKKPLLRLR
ncbi:unnamed protein product [Coccothraustes coccothraustes]